MPVRALDVERPRGQRRAGAAGAHERLRPALARPRARPARSRPRASCAPARTGSAALAIETGASTTSTPGRRLAELGGRTEQQHARALAGRDRRARGDLARAEVGAVAVDRDDRRGVAAPGAPVPGRTKPRRHCRARRGRARDRAAAWRTTSRPRVGAAHRAHAVRPARAVALRARVQRGRADLVLGATLGGAAVRLLFLGDGHRREKATSRTRGAHTRARSSRSFAQRGSGAGSWWCSGPSLVEVGRADRAEPRAVLAAEDLRRHRERERVARPRREVERLVAHVGAVELLAPARAGRPRAPPPRRAAAPSFRQRMHGPRAPRARSAAAARSPPPVMRETSSSHRHPLPARPRSARRRARAARSAISSVEPPALAGRQAQAREVEIVGRPRAAIASLQASETARGALGACSSARA